MKPLKLLVIPSYRLFPIESGGAHGQLTFLDKQQHFHEIDLIMTPENIDYINLDSFKRRFPKINVLPICFDKPKPVQKVFSFFRKQFRKVSGKDIAYYLGKSKQMAGILINNPNIVETIKRLATLKNYDIIQVEHVKNIGIVSVLPIDVVKVFIHHEIYHTRVRQDMISLYYSTEYTNYMVGFMEGVEIYLCNKYDGLVTFNEDDNNLLTKMGVKAIQQVAKPFALFENQLIKLYQAHEDQCLVFLGGETHYPNKHGMEWFLNNVFPIVKKQNRGIVLKISGNWTKEFINRYSNDSQIVFTGFLDNLDVILRNGILIVPIHIGSGIRVKVYSSLAKALPIVSTELGASGIPDLLHGENIMLADEPDAFAKSILELIDNEELRKKISLNAYELAKSNFASSEFVNERNDFYELLISQKEKGLI